MNDRHAVRVFAVLVMAGLLSGCATLTVSVDVYKGPLANDEHVLTEQTAVMAIGAKPLLKQLRCELLRRSPKAVGAARNQREDDADVAGSQKDNQTPRDPECDVALERVSWERKERARRVEAVSTLYEDQLDSVPGLSGYFSVAHMKQEEFETALNTLQADRKEEESLWERVKPRSGNESDQVLKQLFREFQIESANQQEEVKEARRELAEAVKEVMVIPEDGYRLARRLLYSYVRLDRLLQESIDEGVRRTTSDEVWSVPAQQVDPPYDGQTTTAYALLAQEEVQHHLTRMLFGSEDSDRGEPFMKHLAIIASSFLDTRRALRDLWIESIQFLGFLNDPPINDKNRQWVEDIEAARPRLTLAIAPFIAALTDVQDIAVTICLRDSVETACSDNPPPPSPEKDISTLRKYLVEQSRPEVWEICPGKANCDFKADWNPSRLRKARRALEFAIIARPKEMLDLLLRSDEIFRRIPYTEFQERLPAKGGPSVVRISIPGMGYARFQRETDYKQGDYRWEYYCREDLGGSMQAACRKTRDFGIAELRRRGLRLQETLRQNIAVVEEAGGVGLGKGRLPEGLDTLIEEYIETAADEKRNVKDTEFKRGRLLNALVRFAEKVLVIANHQELLDPSENEPSGNKPSGKDDLNNYVVTLQAIGNAIIVQADDLIRRRSHRTDLERRALAEIEALKQVAMRNAEQVLKTVRQDLVDMYNGATEDLAEKMAEKAKAEEGVADKRRIWTGISERTAPLQFRDEEPDRKLAAAIDGGELEFHAWRTISGKAAVLPQWAPPGKVALFGEDGSVLERDAKEIRSRILHDQDAANTPMAIRQDIEAWISGETPSSGTGTARYSRLTKTKDLLTAAANQIDESEALQGDTRQSTFEKIKAFIERQYIAAKNEISRAADIVFKSLEGGAKEELAAAKELVQKLEDEVTELEDRKKAVADAMAVTQSVIDSTLQPMIQAETLRDGAAAFTLLPEEIEKRAARFERIKLDPSVTRPEKDRAEAEHRRAENALAVFGELSVPPKGIPGLQGQAEAGKPALSQLDVLDKMIAHLRYELIRAESDGDQNNANQIQQALDSAYDHRAGMAFIRPSSAFLRSSYAGTGLQDDPGLTWRNMLKEHAKRAWRDKEEEPTSRVIAETDKQFWQNINKVRVDGGGNTNYVLAKDDVGNWYVKSYSTDRTAIFQSASNLALFGAGAALDLNLMERMVLEQEFQEKGSGLDGDKQKRLDELRGEQAKAGTPAALSGVYNKYRAQYNDMTDKAHAKLKQELAPSSEDSDTQGTELGVRILAAWRKQPALTAHLGHLGEALLARSDAIGQRHDEMVQLEDEQSEGGQPLSPDVKAQRQAAQIIDALRSVADFEAGLVSVIDRTGPLVSSLATAVQEKTKAEGEYAKARQERQGLEKQLTEKKVEIENKRMGISSIDGNTEETENQKKAALDALNQEESQIEEQLNGRIEEAKRAEGDRKTAFDEAAKAHDAVRQAQQLAKATVAGIAGALFRDVLEARQQTVREYETAITYVGDLPSN